MSVHWSTVDLLKVETNKSVQSADKNVYNQDVVFLIAYLLIA